MVTPKKLEKRLNEIADTIHRSGRAYALLGLGSAGIERSRLDEYSDLDFFVIAKEGYKQAFIDDLQWLTSIEAKGYSLKNTVDGHKFLFSDGIFCEFAVFEPGELPSIPFARGQVIWSDINFDCRCLEPTNSAGIYEINENTDWIIGESLTNLYVGLGRYCRGEKLSAMRFVQSFSLDRLVDLIHLRDPESNDQSDQYMPDRRIEFRIKEVESDLIDFAQGYEKTPESALAQLNWLEKNYDVNESIAIEIRRLVDVATTLN
ncbi:hypothetical protein [Reinekea sp.]|jgi:hypothetical protein|uniref:hypothetical protein n=1 Tax=Reinekea sp. TaxID=1970455 RepID=UPI003989475A